MPDVKLLSNGNYHVMLTSAGGGYSGWKGFALTRWREDAALDNWGAFCYLRDCVSGAVWSSTHQPTLQRPDACQTSFSAGSATFLRQDHEIETRTEIAVSPDDDVELRQVRITNLSQRSRILSGTSFAEIVLAPAATDAAHPAFSKLFVETEIDPALHAIFATRRPSTPDDPTLWFFHLALSSGSSASEATYETDRMRFIGRGRGTYDPEALRGNAPLPGSAGPVLDAVAAIRVPFTLAAGASLTIKWITGTASSREACAALATKYQDADLAQRILERSMTYRQATLQRLQASDADALLYERAAASILYADAALRAEACVIQQNRRGQSSLWGFGISGDLPVVLLQLTACEPLDLLRQVVQAHAYWRAYGIKTELAVISLQSGDHEPTLFEQLKQLIASGPGAECVGKPGGIFILDNSLLDDGDRILLQSVARAVFSDAAGTLAQQIDPRHGAAKVASAERTLAPGVPTSTAMAGACGSGALNPDVTSRPSLSPPSGDLIAFNGFGGFTPDAREYVITSSSARMTPAPWVNVLANPDFGTLVSESGSSTTWSENAHEFRLTPWSNDPVSDANTEAFYIRDEASGRFWSPTLLPTRSAAPYATRHGFGYSVFEHFEDGIESRLCMYVAINSPVKFAVLKLHNRSDRQRRLSVTGYLDWVLGDERAKTLMHVVTELDTETGALFAHNAYNTDFSGRTAFFDVDASADTICGDRGDFFGPCGTLAAPAALAQAQLSGHVGAALDPCAALRIAFELAPAEEREIIFRLGVGKSADEARDLVRRWRGSAAAHAALAAVHQYWRTTLGTIQIQTPDASLNALANGWLIYQVMASRLWGRTAFYQSSGAFGFRDQLQDVMALVHAQPALVREHLLRAASRQFPEGDVQHWWHPPSGKGVRTRCSDDYLWLPLATCRYIEITGDTGVLDEPCHFLESRLLKDGEQSNYELPKTSDQTASLYEHCVRSIRSGLRYGEHGLPLMGAGDWNDGMNLVGAGGKGESVWLGFFLITVLSRFAPLARQHADPAFAGLCESEATGLRQRMEATGWDGAWYKRAWFDDGSPLGSAGNAEFEIDSIAQSWAVLSNAAAAERASAAMNSVDQRLVHRDSRLIQLLDPPFDTSRPSPGYIQGYVPGVRENGGQYTHAAVWTTMAFAALGDAERAWELLDMLNPLKHGDSAGDAATYKVEPYVVAGDVYAFAPHAGRGGWTWYTGSAGWMYQLITESLLGLRRTANKLRVSPLLPPHWKTLDIQYRFGDTHYSISCRSGLKKDAAAVLDGKALENAEFELINDRQDHFVIINLQSGQAARKRGAKCK